MPQSGRGEELRFDLWTTEQGLPQNSVFSICQSEDGYLWMGTFEGLARFDGVNFKVFDNTNTPGLENNWVKSVVRDRAGNLWAGTDGSGLFRRVGNELIRDLKSNELPSQRIMTLFADRAGNLWIGTQKGLSLLKSDGELKNFTARDGLPSDVIRALDEDDWGALWIGTNKGLARFKDEKFTVYQQTDGLTNDVVNALAWSRNGGLWIGTDKGLSLLRDEHFIDFAAKSETNPYWITSLGVDRAGALWIGTQLNGLMRFAGGAATDRLETIENSPVAHVLAIYEDSENRLWFGGAGTGLARLKSGRFQTILRSEGLREDYVTAVYEDRSRNLWVSTDKTLYRLNDGKLEPHSQPVAGDFYAIAEDSGGALWLASYRDRGRVWRLKNGQYTALTAADGLPNSRANAIIGDRAGNVWIGTVDGLAVLRDGRLTVYKTSEGLVGNYVNQLYEATDGSVWIGTRDGVSRWQNGRFTSWTIDNGLGSNLILSFYEASDGAMWIGTETGGLVRYKNGEFVGVNTRNGLYDNLVSVILESNGDLWMSGNKGIYRANLQELNDFADGRSASVASFSYGTADGMLLREGTGGARAGWKTADGNLWFPTIRGVFKVDTTKRNSQPPAVLIEKIKIDEQIVPTTDAPLQITPGQESLEINYTALSWERPRHIRFKYQIVGLDRDWTDAGTRRTAYFSHLPAGEYTFRVIADNGDGVWNTEGKSLKISVLPTFYQTRWFLALCILAIGGAAFVVYKIRVNRLERARLAQQEFSRRLINAHEEERSRVAAELHDSIGQTLAMIKNRAAFGAQTDDPTTAKEQLAAIGAQTTQAISEVREISYNLRPYLLENLGLTKAIKSLIHKIEEVHLLTIDARIDDVDGVFSAEAEMSVYRIVQESLNNVAKHAEADEVVLRIEKSSGGVTIKIEDDGCGFDQNAQPKIDGEKGGFGLVGIAERVRMLDGLLDIRTAIGGGTKLEIKIATHNPKINEKNA